MATTDMHRWYVWCLLFRALHVVARVAEEGPECSSHTEPGRCRLDGCSWHWDTSACRVTPASCATRVTWHTCLADTGCTWDVTQRACVVQTRVIPDLAWCATVGHSVSRWVVCDQEPRCHWDLNTARCVPRPTHYCPLVPTETQCEEITGCHWDRVDLHCEGVTTLGELCSAGNNRSELCTTFASCSWDSATGRCSRLSTLTQLRDEKQKYLCERDWSQPHYRVCHTSACEQQCEALPGCQWQLPFAHQTDAPCVPHAPTTPTTCTGLPTWTTCQEARDPSCAWNKGRCESYRQGAYPPPRREDASLAAARHLRFWLGLGLSTAVVVSFLALCYCAPSVPGTTPSVPLVVAARPVRVHHKRKVHTRWI